MSINPPSDLRPSAQPPRRPGDTREKATLEQLCAFRAARDAFESRLEAELRWFRTSDFVPAIVQRWRQLRSRFGRRYSLEHYLLQAIEAHCAYVRSEPREVVRAGTYDKIHNLIADFNDPALAFLIQTNLQLFFQSMVKQQLEPCARFSRSELFRWHQLLVRSSKTEALRETFKEKHEIELEEFVRAAVLANAISELSASGTFDLGPGLLASTIRMDRKAFDLFVAAASLTPKELGAAYRTARGLNDPSSLAALFYSQAASPLRSKPILSLGSGRFCLPLPGLIPPALFPIIADLCNEVDSRLALGPAFNEYLADILNNVGGWRIAEDAQIERLASGKSADFLVQTPEGLIVVEAKAIRFSREKITDQTLVADGSTSHTRTSALQHRSVLNDINAGRFHSLGVPAGTVPIAQFTVTLGELPSPNTRWYRQLVFEQHFASRGEPPEGYVIPEVVSASTFERILAYAKSGGSTVDLLQERAAMSDSQWREWNVFMQEKTDGLPLLPIIEAGSDRVLNTFLPPGSSSSSQTSPSGAGAGSNEIDAARQRIRSARS